MARDSQTSRLVDAILKSIILGGAVSLVVVAPNSLQLAEKALRHIDKRSRNEEMKRVIGYMRRQRLLEYRELADNSLEVTITTKGRKRVERVDFDNMVVGRLKTWDQKWRLVIFDIPEKNRTSRTALSAKLRDMGFYQLQKSVWAHAYPCREIIELVRQVYEISQQEIFYGELDYIDYDYELRKHFGLLNKSDDRRIYLKEGGYGG
jgi:CRISPR/Cas system-associated endoribonuclease Cas2